MKNNMTNDMTNGNPVKLILLFSIPLLIGNIFQQFYNMVDTIIVGRFVGVDALAAVGATSSMVFLVNGFATGLSSGFAVLVSQRFGAKDEKGLRKAVASAITLTIISVVIITIVSLLGAMPLLKLMNTPENIINDAYLYIKIIYAGVIATVAYNLIASILRALGDSKTPLYFLIISSVSCVSKQIGNAFTPPNSLKRAAFPSITGMAARAPILPRPSTALPSDTTATVFDLIVYV